MSGLKHKVAKGAAWVILEKFAINAVHFVVAMVLARLLTPTDYGTVALLSIFFAVAGSLASCGFGNALVQKKDVGDLEFNSVFYASLFISCVIYAIFFFSAPLIADFYRVPVLCSVVRVSALSFIFNAINSVQSAELSRNMLFDRRFRISAITCAVSSTCGITLAYLGWGVWALVLASLISNITSVIAFWCIIAWRPKCMFNFSSLKDLFSYGWKISVAGLLDTTYSNLSGFLIGKFYSPADLAFVNKGNSMPNLLMSTIDGTINNVSFPALARIQEDKKKVREGMRRILQCSTFLVFPLLAGLCLCARPLVVLLYGEQWIKAVPYVMVACFSFSLLPFNTINIATMNAMGRSDLYLQFDGIKKIVGIFVIIVSLRYSVMAFVLSMAFIQAPFGVVVNTIAAGKLLGYNLLMQLRDVVPSIVFTGIMASAVVCVQHWLSPSFTRIPVAAVSLLLELLISGVVGVAVYLSLSLYFKPQPFREYINAILPMLQPKMPLIARAMEKFYK